MAIQLAQHFNTKIISADSRQCFKELNIGVAKPSTKELQIVEHFFINSHSIHQQVNAVVFEQYALQKVQEIFASNNIAIMVGGTGLYIKAFCEGLDEMPTIPIAIREKMNVLFKQNGLHWLQEEVQKKDPVFWQNAEQQNPHRLLRALEIMEFTEKSITDFRKQEKQQRNFNILKIGLELPREILYERINNRVEAMLKEGLVNEVKTLLPFENLNALQTVGYKEFFEYLKDKCTLNFAIEELKKNTRHYAKRQMTWFKKDKEINWFKTDDVEAIIEYLKTKEMSNKN